MKVKNIFSRFLIVLLVLCACYSFNFINVNASTDTQKIPASSSASSSISSGGYITYKGTNIQVEIPVNYEQKTTEFRGVWVSPFAGDISGYRSTKESLQNELLSVLKNMESYNLNAIVFHIRTHNDALYDTDLAPKSSYISSADFEEWDYLEWFIDECHSRGIEFHAWLNPYRISSTKTTLAEVTSRYADYPKNPASKAENVLISTNGAILNPGTPEVKEYLVDVCMEVIEKYDVDAIHFDDYFYEKGINDTDTYEKYKSKYGNVGKADFRRLQVDEFIENLSNEIKKYNKANNKAVQLGVSPTAIYANGSTAKYNADGTLIAEYDSNGCLVSPLASNTSGYSHYGDPLYCDTLKWINNEWIDYITPQIYHSFENSGDPYADTTKWWAAAVKYKKVNLYTGIGIYKTLDSEGDSGWGATDSKNFEYSLLYNQTLEEVDGFCLYQYKTLITNQNNADIQNVFSTMITNKAITPRSQRYNIEVDSVTDLKIAKGNGTFNLQFLGSDNAVKYAIYKSKETIDVNNPSHLVALLGDAEVNYYIDNETDSSYNYGVVAISQSNNVSELVTIKASDAQTEIDYAFGKINGVYCENDIKNGSSYQITIEKADLYAGSNFVYKLYSSYDQENWELTGTINYFVGTKGYIKSKFNTIYKPIYHKVVIENEFGEIESEIFKVDISKITTKDILDYIDENFKNNISNIFQ